MHPPENSEQMMIEVLRRQYGSPKISRHFHSSLLRQTQSVVARESGTAEPKIVRQSWNQFIPITSGVAVVASVLAIAAFFVFGSHPHAVAIEQIAARLQQVGKNGSLQRNH